MKLLCLIAGVASAADKKFEFDYEMSGEDWGELEGAEICATGKEQSPIDLSTREFEISETMELNGYDYIDFTAYKADIKLPTYETAVEEGEFILNLFNGKKQLFNPIQFHFHSPSEHTVDG